MTMWRLEWLRLIRTRRLLVLLGVYLFFGLTGPLTARYLETIVGRLGTEGVRVEFPPPTPADGIAQFVGNASQVGIAYGALFLAFAGATVALAAALVKGVLATAGTALVAVLGMGIAGNLTGAERWLPTTLLGAMTTLVGDASPTRYLPAAAVTVVAGCAALAAAIAITGRREI